jgi:ATP-dependent DNA helicase RecG
MLRLKGVGEHTAKLLAKIRLTSSDDLIENIPRRYEDYSVVTCIKDIAPGVVTIKATVTSVKSRYSGRGLHITEATATDVSGNVKIIWFNQPYRAQSIKVGAEYYISGEYAQSIKYRSLTNPTCELVSSFPLHTARLVPIYKLTKGLSSYTLRKVTKNAFDEADIQETLPKWLIDEKELIDRRTALFSMHFPETVASLDQARRRLGFEELFRMSLASELNRRDFAQEKALHIPISESRVKKYVSSLPFSLTDDQRKAAWQILKDTSEGAPMNRLLQGDVGSGKTVVASIAMLNCALAGYQAALMAPTELLAIQHMTTISYLLPKGLKERIACLTGSQSAAKKKALAQDIANGKILLLIGTHALIEDTITFKDLGLIVIDEQHRFGVEQRKRLQGKAKVMPHVLNMTATPIPRSLMLTLYNELSASTIRQKPASRLEVVTKRIAPEARQALYQNIVTTELDKGRQLFVVCPKIEEQNMVSRPLSVESIHKQVSGWLKGFRVGVLHGKLPTNDKNQLMLAFQKRELDVLVSTTVIEVGVDVPNASVMVVEGADLFGLAQLHQLRGRVGRGSDRGYCYLIPVDNGETNRRLQLLEQQSDGFALAEYDLKLRGPGAIYGTTQHGELDLRVAKITDTELITEARLSAKEFISRGEHLIQYKELEKHVNRLRAITNLN